MKRKFRISLVVFFSAMGGMLYGYDIGIINSAFLFINKDIPMGTFEVSLLGGSVLLGGAFAILLAGFIADAIGRKNTLKLSGLIFIVSVFMICESNNYQLLLISRLIQGISVGFITVTAPLYLTETVPDNIRGIAVTCFQLFLTAGILISNYIGLLFVDTHNWRGMFLTSLIPAAIFFGGSFLIFRSPRWLIAKNKEFEAKAIFNIIYPTEDADVRVSNIKETLEDKADGLIKILKNRHFLIPAMIVISIAVLNQMTGINSILQYSSIMLKDSGLGGNYVSVIGGIAVTAINFLVTLFAVIIAERVERRTIVIFGTFMVSLSLILTGTVMIALPDSPLKGALLLCGLISFIFFFALGSGSYVWVIMSELLPNSIRSKALATALFLNSMASAVLASVFLPMIKHLGESSVFFLCGVCTVVYCCIVYKFVPKTTGRSLEDIEHEFMK